MISSKVVYQCRILIENDSSNFHIFRANNSKSLVFFLFFFFYTHWKQLIILILIQHSLDSPVISRVICNCAPLATNECIPHCITLPQCAPALCTTRARDQFPALYVRTNSLITCYPTVLIKLGIHAIEYNGLIKKHFRKNFEYI